MNILSPKQQMNVSFGPFRIVNSYGAFGTITKVRNEGTTSKVLNERTIWKDFEFTCKPGDINRRPCLISPYHIRMDWLMWFAAFQNYQHCPWIVHLADKLLEGHNITNQLLAVNGNPFRNHTKTLNDPHGSIYINQKKSKSEKITFIRAELYEYQFASLTPLSESERQEAIKAGWELGQWWKRKYVGNYMPAIDRNNYSVKQFLKANQLIL